MVQDIVIRTKFLAEYLRKSILIDDNFHPNIIKAWKEDIRYGIECEDEQIYDLYNAEDLKKCIDEGMDAEYIAYLVNRYQNEKYQTQFFVYKRDRWLLLCRKYVINDIEKHIENIAYNILKYPYKDTYARLYREFVVPMIELQV